jgi:hypothetical protein
LKRHVHRIPFLVLTALVVAGSASAGLPVGNPQALTGVSTPPSAGLLRSGLIDLSRFDISHSLSYGVSSSSSFGTHSGGLWLTEIGYRIADPLRVSVDVGAALDTDGGGPILSEKSFYLRGFNLDYQPSRTFRLNISYVNTPPNAASVLGYDYPGTGLGYRPYGPFRGLDR